MQPGNCEVIAEPSRQKSFTFYLVGIFNKAYLRSANVQKAAKGFECTGIVPLNLHVSIDAAFAVANVTDNQDEKLQVDVGNTAAFFHLQVFKFQFHLHLQGKEMLQKRQLKKLLTQVIMLPKPKKQQVIPMNCSIRHLL